MRVSFGVSSCKGGEKCTKIKKIACDAIFEEVERLKKLRFSQIKELDDKELKNINYQGLDFILAIYKVEMENSIHLVVQCFYRTLLFPSYLSIKGIGRMYAEGIVAYPTGEFAEANDEILLDYW